MRDPRKLVFVLLAFICAAVTLFFGSYGALLIYTALTFEGEGSLGHVGMYITAGLFPFFAFVFGAFTFLAWRAAYRDHPMHRRPPNETLSHRSRLTG